MGPAMPEGQSLSVQGWDPCRARHRSEAALMTKMMEAAQPVSATEPKVATAGKAMQRQEPERGPTVPQEAGAWQCLAAQVNYPCSVHQRHFAAGCRKIHYSPLMVPFISSSRLCPFLCLLLSWAHGHRRLGTLRRV